MACKHQKSDKYRLLACLAYQTTEIKLLLLQSAAYTVTLEFIKRFIRPPIVIRFSTARDYPAGYIHRQISEVYGPNSQTWL